MDLDKIRAHYNEHHDWLATIATSVRTMMSESRREFGEQNPDVGMPKAPEARVKTLASIVDKINRKPSNWPHPGVFHVDDNSIGVAIVNDLVAGRIVCATTSDVDRLADLIARSEALRNASIDNKYIPETGYRACHIDGHIQVLHGVKHVWFPIEIQIKTLLQDAWANFGHPEFYKPDSEPPLISLAVAKHLSDVLDGIDHIGQAIREEKHRKKRAPTAIRPDETHVTSRTLRYILAEQMGVRDISFDGLSDLEIEQCIHQLTAYGYSNLALVGAMVEDAQVESKVQVAKADIGILTRTSPFELLYFGPVAVRENQTTLHRELRRFYRITEHRCGRCSMPITHEQKDYVDKFTDLDTVMMCKSCCDKHLKKCTKCDKRTEAEVCKDCRSHNPALEIV